MDLIHKFINIIRPPLAIFFFPSYLFNFVTSTLNSIFNQDNIAGKVVLITGASSGIGEHLAYEYARRGAYLAVAARRKNSLWEVTGRALRLGSPDAISIPTDVSKVDEYGRLKGNTLFFSFVRSGDSVHKAKGRILLAPPANILWPSFLVYICVNSLISHSPSLLSHGSPKFQHLLLLVLAHLQPTQTASN